VRRTVAHEAELEYVHVFDTFQGSKKRVGRGLLAGDHGLHTLIDTSHFAQLIQGRAPVDTAFSKVHVSRAVNPVPEEARWNLVLGMRE
jgi:hypothetical protein